MRTNGPVSRLCKNYQQLLEGHISDDERLPIMMIVVCNTDLTVLMSVNELYKYNTLPVPGSKPLVRSVHLAIAPEQQPIHDSKTRTSNA